MKTNLDTAVGQFPALSSPNARLAARCALEWYDLTAEDAQNWFTEDCVYENRCNHEDHADTPGCDHIPYSRSSMFVGNFPAR